MCVTVTEALVPLNRVERFMDASLRAQTLFSNSFKGLLHSFTKSFGEYVCLTLITANPKEEQQRLNTVLCVEICPRRELIIVVF